MCLQVKGCVPGIAAYGATVNSKGSSAKDSPKLSVILKTTKCVPVGMAVVSRIDAVLTTVFVATSVHEKATRLAPSWCVWLWDPSRMTRGSIGGENKKRFCCVYAMIGWRPSSVNGSEGSAQYGQCLYLADIAVRSLQNFFISTARHWWDQSILEGFHLFSRQNHWAQRVDKISRRKKLLFRKLSGSCFCFENQTSSVWDTLDSFV